MPSHATDCHPERVGASSLPKLRIAARATAMRGWGGGQMAMRTGTTAGAVFVVSVLCTFGATSGGPAVAEDAPDALVARGDYLVNSILACGNCHTPMGPEGPDFTRALSGGLQFDEPPFTVSAPNLTADPTGLGEWSDEEIRRAL